MTSLFKFIENQMPSSIDFAYVNILAKMLEA